MTVNEARDAHRCEENPNKNSILSKLTPREREILDLIGRGLSTAEIAKRLHRSEKTIKSHRLALGRKLNVSNRVELARIAIEAGLAPLNSTNLEPNVTHRQLREEIAQHERAQKALRAMDAGTASATGEDFFELLVKHLAESLQVKFAMIGDIVLGASEEIHTMAVWRKGEAIQNFAFKIAGTPCEHALRTGTCFYRQGVQEVFHVPDAFGEDKVASYLGNALIDSQGTPVGILVVAHDGEIDETLEPEMILRLFSGRAGAELQRYKMEERLRLSESRLSQAQRIAQLGHWNWDIANDEVEWSEEVFRIFGAKVEDFEESGNAFLNRVHPEDRPRIVAAIDATLRAGVPYREEYRLLLPDGEIRHGLSRGEVTYDDSGKPIRMLGTVQDITERIRFEMALRDSEKLHRLIAENVPAGIAYIDADYRYRFVNELYTNWFGLTREEVIGRTMSEIVGNRAFQSRKEQIDRALSGETQVYEIEANANGTRDSRWFNVNCAPDIDESGKVRGSFFLGMDITEQKNAVESLRQICDSMGLRFREQRRELCDTNAELNREIRLRLEIEENLKGAQSYLQRRMLSPSAVIYTCEPEGDFGATFISDNVRDMLGFESSSFVGQNTFWNNHIHPDDLERVLEDLNELKQGQRFVLEYRFLHKDGNYRWLYDELNTICDDDGKPVEIMGFVLDITDRKNLELDLKKAAQALEHRVDDRTRELSLTRDVLRMVSNERAKAEAGLQAVLKGTATTTGEAFFKVLIKHLADALGMSHSYLSELSESEPGKLQVAAAWPILDPTLQNMTYEIDGSPCEIVLREGSYCHPSDVQGCFMKDEFLREIHAESYLGVALQDSTGRRIGVLTVLGERPIVDPEHAKSILKIFASRASSEFQRLHAERQLVTGQARQEAILASTVDPLVVINQGGIIQSASRSVEDVFGWTADDLVGQDVNILMPDPYCWEDARNQAQRRSNQRSEAVDQTMEIQGKHRNGRVFPVDFTIWSVAIPGEDNEIFTGIFRDDSERKKSESQLRLVAQTEQLRRQEMNHRFGNNLNSLMTLVMLSKNEAISVDDFAASIMSRVENIATVHTLITQGGPNGIALLDLCETIASEDENNQLSVSGDEISIRPDQATVLATIIHELIMNSRKYGALSSPRGRIKLECRINHHSDEGPKLELEWCETGGLPIEDAPEPGVGMRIIEGLVKVDLRGESIMNYPPSGAHHVFRVTLDTIEHEQESVTISNLE